MSWWNLFQKPSPEIVNVVNKPRPEAAVIDQQIFKQQLVRVRQDAARWRQALINAENPQNPTRDQLYTIYEDTILDSHLKSVMKQRSNSVSAMGFKIVNSQNEEEGEQTAIFKTKWFNTYQNLILSTPYFGFTVIQLNGIINDKFVGPNNTPGVRLINRRLYFPEEQIIRDSPQSMSGVKWHDDRFKDWVITEGNPEDLGLLNGITPLTLMKKGLVQFWAEYAELFGQPTRVLHTDTQNLREQKKQQKMLENMGSLNFAILKTNDVLELLSSRQEDAHEVYEQFLKYVDGSNSKVVIGQTMTTDDGSSLSQADVHERTREIFTRDDKNMLLYNVNDELIPRMNMLGFNISSGSFRIDDKEVLSLTDQFKIDIDLLKSKEFKFKAEYFRSKYGTELEDIDRTQLDSEGLRAVERLQQIYLPTV